MPNQDPEDVIILGTHIGAETGGWEQIDTFVILLYDFTPNEIGRSLGMIAGDLQIDFESGWSQDNWVTSHRLLLTKVEQ